MRTGFGETGRATPDAVSAIAQQAQTSAEAVDCGGSDDGGLPVPPSLIVIVVVALVLLVGAWRIIRSNR